MIKIYKREKKEEEEYLIELTVSIEPLYCQTFVSFQRMDLNFYVERKAMIWLLKCLHL